MNDTNPLHACQDQGGWEWWERGRKSVWSRITTENLEKWTGEVQNSAETTTENLQFHLQELKEREMMLFIGT